MTPRIKRVFIAVFLALTAALIISTVQGYLSLFSSRNGLLFENGEPVGGDFVAFFTGGSLALSPNPTESLYSFSHQHSFQESLFEKDSENFKFLPFVYPPAVALLFAPLSDLSFLDAYFAWSAISFLLSAVAVSLLLKTMRASTGSNLLLIGFGVLAFTPLTIDNFGGGQLASVGLLILSCTALLLRKEKLFCAGFILAFGYYKIPLFLLLWLALSLTQPRRFVVGLITGLFSITIVEGSFFGLGWYQTYLEFLSRYLSGDVEALAFKLPSNLGVGLYSPLQQFAPFTAPIAIAVLFITILYILWRAEGLSALELFSMTLVFSLSLSFQVNNYDLTLLLPAIFIMTPSWKRATPAQRLVLIISLIAVTAHCIGVTPEPLLLPILSLSSLLFVILPADVRKKLSER